ncbi:helix-turn-helix domain-containing protein [Zunongwangia pacifica]|uniref:Helix-turn-helix transcriptional regulator n=1 Tax=Zunongwangia pacifica TaxID=2911062 RepID=A0A9X1ZVR7_9FLAO|nr:helix-turn-helix transcriptional regulator [Zunongwangia pacifica]MCL6218588.1 helix-turn-helix transcriptional regulator [Zunongwangia pacifica]
MTLSQLLKHKRETKGLLLREVASIVTVDTALISKLEKGDRKPTREQLKKLAIALEIEHVHLLKLWLSEKVYEGVKGEDVAVDAVELALKRLKEQGE